jgi:hypothetical protein
MTLIKKGALSGLQVYLSVPWAKKPLTFRNPPPWAPAKVESLSGPQLLAAYSLAKAAYDFAWEQKGKIRYKGRNIPIGAVIVAQAVSKGAGVHGGKTIEERAKLRHAAAATTIAYLESLIRTKGLTVPAISRPALPG